MFKHQVRLNMCNELKKKGEYCLHLMGYRSLKNNTVWKKTFGFALITAVVEECRIIFKVYASEANKDDSFHFKAVAVPLVKGITVEETCRFVASAECDLGIMGEKGRIHINWGHLDPEVLGISDWLMSRHFNKEGSK